MFRDATEFRDVSDERAEVVRQLNAAGIPVVGIPLLPLAEGYSTTYRNFDPQKQTVKLMQLKVTGVEKSASKSNALRVYLRK